MEEHSAKTTVAMETRPYDKCPECGERNVSRNPKTGESFCEVCGFVINERTMESTFDEECDAEKSNSMNYRGNIQTYVGHEDDINNGRHRKLKRINRNTRYQDIQSTRGDGITKIGRTCTSLSLPDNVQENSILLFVNLQENKEFFTGRRIEELVGSIIYWSCRQYRVPRTKEEISKHLGISVKRIHRVYLDICNEMETGHLPFEPEDYLNRYFTELGLNGKKRKRCRKIVDELNGFANGRNPRGIVGAVIKYVYGKEITISKLCETISMSKDCIRLNLRELEEKLEK